MKRSVPKPEGLFVIVFIEYFFIGMIFALVSRKAA